MKNMINLLPPSYRRQQLIRQRVLQWSAVMSGVPVLGWALQFVGHAFEGKPPEFFKDWRFLFVGFRWWLLKITGRV